MSDTDRPASVSPGTPAPAPGGRTARDTGRPTTPALALGPAGPVRGPLTDRFGRVHTDLRVSLTDRCSLRCVYCVPADGLPCLPRRLFLSADETVRVVRVATQMGVRKVRLTGGEPLLRTDVVEIVAALAHLSAAPEVSLTTNGLGLARLAAPLAAAGLRRVNVSLDTLDRTRFTTLTRSDRLDDVLRGLAAARAAGLAPVKLNTVLLPGLNDDEAPALLDFALAHGYALRFIEQMPLGDPSAWDRTQMVTAAQVLASLRRTHVLTPVAERGGAPAERFVVDGGPAQVGIVAAITRPFCADCSRLRLTADGQLRSCLFATAETDLRSVLRAGGTDDDIATALRTAVAGKGPGHQVGETGFAPPARLMRAIGG